MWIGQITFASTTHTRIVLGEPMCTSEMNSYDAAMFHIFHCNSLHVTTADWNEFLNKVSDIKNKHRLQTNENIAYI
jgi:hypothetical protein